MKENIKANKDFPLIQSIANVIKKKFNKEKIILFGSRSYGKAGEGSDIDLFIIMNSDIPVRQQAVLIRKEYRGPVPLDIIVRTPQQVETRLKLGDFFIRNILQKGIVL